MASPTVSQSGGVQLPRHLFLGRLLTLKLEEVKRLGIIGILSVYGTRLRGVVIGCFIDGELYIGAGDDSACGMLSLLEPQPYHLDASAGSVVGTPGRCWSG